MKICLATKELSRNVSDWKWVFIKVKTLNSKLQEQTMKERQIWKQVLTRLLNVVKFLTKWNLPLRCHRYHVYSSNKGNFIELLSQYDPVLGKQYLKEVNGNCRYLSPKIQNEFIHILGNHAKENILDRIRKTTYFAIILDSTPDISQTDPMSFICQYVVIEDREVEVQEPFVGFITEYE